MSTQTISIPDIAQIPTIPPKGKAYLSVNLALANPGQVWAIAEQLGFTPKLVYLVTRLGIEIHCLLHEGEYSDSVDFETEIEAMRDADIDIDAIRFAYARPAIAA
ncbi:MAG: hypothetical protein F6K04_01255 [Leptolyngbya sp. SIO4C5]|uniref:hypothetical protein n=1 Tax=Sphaerothrix gracilis TaxID=3151835 RepID=UPI0013BF4C63|nr:hypothetical protein [Leptolyngbya sp. SIO4C5]